MGGDVPLDSAQVGGGTSSGLEAAPGSSSSPFQAGALVYCQVLLRGVVRAVKAMVVESGPARTVLACPAAVGIASSGEWAASLEACRGTSFECSCAEAGKSCAVVFYDVNTAALSFTALPGATDFKTADDELALPATDSLVDLFHGEAGGDFLIMQTDHGDVGGANQLYHEVTFGDKHDLFVWNSVLLLPDFLTKDECSILIEAGDRSAHSGTRASTEFATQEGMSRLPVRFLDLEAQLLTTSIEKRLKRILEEQFPELCENIFGRRHIKDMNFSFWPGEPAVNRYMVGGGLNPHTDKRTFTINVPLSELGAFSGGGTVFWPQGQLGPLEHSNIDKQGGVLVRPCQGTAVLFNGSVTHAGRIVTSGIRHLFSASFNLWSLDED
ncbi:unnamed protein product [Polarella glacialis]|uniref:Fe2OG dioxygenase domain-containing protein n=1 Tax=Polarella glacialis TaxID=89957 RepID=A0A813LT49_POLGL|nr:unnamed protein product [Polarella glacialis]